MKINLNRFNNNSNYNRQSQNNNKKQTPYNNNWITKLNNTKKISFKITNKPSNNSSNLSMQTNFTLDLNQQKETN